MKNSAITLATLGLTLGSLHAQTVPLLFNYQGNVTSGTGAPLGSAGTAPNYTAAPINRKMLFRIYDAQTAGTLIWSEQQTATISLGEFSVLFGQGSAGVYNGVTEPRPALDTVFTSGSTVVPAGPVRFLEIVVDGGDGTFTTADVPITPRQRITSTAYSFRSRMADTVPNLAITTAALADNSVTAAKIPDNSITALKIADGQVGTTKIPDNAITSAKIADGTVVTADLANAAVTAAKLDPAIGIWETSGGHVFRSAGRVGIGKVPATQLDVVGAIAATGQITTAGNFTATGSVSASSITTTGPFTATNITADGAVRARMGTPGSGGGFAFTGGGNTGLFSTESLSLGLYVNGGEKIRIAPNGFIGINKADPEVALDVWSGALPITMSEIPYDAINGTWTAADTWTPRGVPANEDGIMMYGTVQGTRKDYGGGATKMVGTIGIRTNAWIATRAGLLVYSDRRIKKDIQTSDSAQDLAAIEKLKVTDYRMVDHADGGTAWRKGFIAQEVEEIIPGAVTRSKEYVPDIFSEAASLIWNPGTKTLFVTLTKNHEMKRGDRVRLHMDGKRVDLNVSAAPSAREFEVEKCETAPQKLFVYGKQVNDFCTVDYDRIFTTSVGAIQELKKEKDAEVKALREENAALRDRLAALEASDKSRDAKLAAIETLLQSAAKSGARTVSTNSGE